MIEFFQPPRRLSCGIVIVNDARELLLCHVTGHDHWDLPKGGAMDGETALRAALRETREECGLELDAETLVDLGRLPYRARKDLHLFGARLPRLDPRTLHCDSRFTDGDSGQRWPEMDGISVAARSRSSGTGRSEVRDEPPMARRSSGSSRCRSTPSAVATRLAAASSCAWRCP